MADYRLTHYTAGVLTAERSVADYYEAAVQAAPAVAPERLAHWLTGELFGLLNQASVSIEACPLPPQALAELTTLVECGEINPTTAKAVLAEAFTSGRRPAAIVAAQGLGQLNDPTAVAQFVDQTLSSHPDQVEQYLAGKAAIAQWLFGQVMRRAGGRANPALVRDLLERRLHSLDENRRAP